MLLLLRTDTIALLACVLAAACAASPRSAQGGLERVTVMNGPDHGNGGAACVSGHMLPPADNRPSQPDYRLAPQDLSRLTAAVPRDAIDTIVALARNTRVVILNEDHGASRHRAFGLEVARALKPLGFDLLAVETLSNHPDAAASEAQMRKLVEDGYVRQWSGTYTNDPVFADFLRQALGMGYTPVAYETNREPLPDIAEEIARREQDQTNYIIERALRPKPGSKLFIYVGFSHVAEGPLASSTGGERLWLAARLKRATGINPLTIDQATMAENPTLMPDVDLYALASPKARDRTMVLWHAAAPVVIGPYANAVDLQVVHPLLPPIQGRPGWLAHMGRRPVAIPSQLLPNSGRGWCRRTSPGRARAPFPWIRSLHRPACRRPF